MWSTNWPKNGLSDSSTWSDTKKLTYEPFDWLLVSNEKYIFTRTVAYLNRNARFPLIKVSLNISTFQLRSGLQY